MPDGSHGAPVPLPVTPLPVTCRRLWPGDRAAVLAHARRLDPETRAARFMAAVSERAALAQAERALTAPGAAFGLFVGGTLRGIGELRPAGRPPAFARLFPVGLAGELGTRAEAALAVERGYRGAGLGGVLLGRMTEAARHRGVREVTLRWRTANGPMRRLAARLGAEIRRRGPESEGAIRMRRPTPVSLWGEGVTAWFELALAAARPSAER